MSKVIIIGAGVSGLVAAIELENGPFNPIILEATDRVGGRVKTDDLNGYPADHGFQVLLTNYPEAKRYLNFETLDLIQFLPGSIIFKNGRMEKIGDPLRAFSFLLPTTFAKIGTLKDKRLILRLALSLKKKPIEDIFSGQEKSTMKYLQDYGFSDSIIHDFFQPFFAGIYLESDLTTSSRMFEFVYKMFGSGYAAIPRQGMQAIPKQLAAKLKRTEIRYNSPVKFVENQTVFLESGEEISADHVIIATDQSSIYSKPKKKSQNWKSCNNLYFESTKSILKNPIIGLLPGKETLVNNFHYLEDLYGQSNGQQSILSVTIVKEHKLSEQDLVRQVKQELVTHAKIETGQLLQSYSIKKALPIIDQLSYQPSTDALKLDEHIYCCGDHLSNSSLNAAMASGRCVAQEIINKALA